MELKKRQRGLTGLEILAIIAAIMVLGVLLALFKQTADNGQREICLKQLDRIQLAVKLALGPPVDRSLCVTANNLINSYNGNGRCPELIGSLGTMTCPP